MWSTTWVGSSHADIRLGWKWLGVTDTLYYHTTLVITKEKNCGRI